MERKVLVDKIEFKDHEAISEAEHLKEMFSLPANLCASYLKFIIEKGLLPEYEEWRKKMVVELL